MKKIKIDMTKAVDRMVKKNGRNVFENQLHTLVDKLKIMEQAKTTVYLLVNIQFEMRQKELMKTCRTSDEIAIKVLENVLLTIKDNSLSPKQFQKIGRLVRGEEKLEDSK
jgi:hypothetical protein